jgi:DNA-directed RNA polymerase specialized sigma24 family protein
MEVDHRIKAIRDSLLASFGRLTHSTEAEDLSQHALLRWAENPHWSRMDSDELSRFLYRIGVNHFRNQLKKQRLSKRQNLNLEAVPCPPLIDVDSGTECLHAIGWLPSPQREVITRVILDGQTNEQAALAMNKPLGTVKTWKRRALARLRAYMAEVLKN